MQPRLRTRWSPPYESFADHGPTLQDDTFSSASPFVQNYFRRIARRNHGAGESWRRSRLETSRSTRSGLCIVLASQHLAERWKIPRRAVPFASAKIKPRRCRAGALSEFYWLKISGSEFYYRQTQLRSETCSRSAPACRRPVTCYAGPMNSRHVRDFGASKHDLRERQYRQTPDFKRFCGFQTKFRLFSSGASRGAS